MVAHLSARASPLGTTRVFQNRFHGDDADDDDEAYRVHDDDDHDDDQIYAV